ncbi:hypothetical protein BG000_002332, partial [Podila horticola]
MPLSTSNKLVPGALLMTLVKIHAYAETLATPDHVCKSECTAQITAATTKIQQILGRMVFQDANGLSTAPLGTSMNMVLFPALTNYLTATSVNLIVVKDYPSLLASTALMLNLTVDMVRGALDTARAQLPLERRTNLDPLIADLMTLQPMLTAIVQCAGGTPVKNCDVGPYALYSSLYTASIARMRALAVVTRAAPINDILQKMGQINPVINDLVAQTAFEYARQSSKDPTDNCQNITERSKNYLTYVFQYFKTIYAQVSLDFVANPLLQTLTNSFLTATNIDITGISNIIAEILYLLKFIAPTGIQSQLTTLINRIRAIQATVQECTGGNLAKGVAGVTVAVVLAAVGAMTSAVCMVPVVNALCPIASYPND